MMLSSGLKPWLKNLTQLRKTMFGAHKFAESKKAIKCKLVLRKKFKVDKRLEFELRGLLNYVVYTSLTRAPVAKFSSVRVINHVCGN